MATILEPANSPVEADQAETVSDCIHRLAREARAAAR